MKPSRGHKTHYLPRVDFDHYKDRYQSEIQKSISFMRQDHEFFTRVKVRFLLRLAEKYLFSSKKIKVLDVGCGVGITDKYLKGHFRKLNGVDIGKGIIQRARKLNPAVTYKVYDGKKLPFADASMDLTFAICVMHHIPPENLDLFVRELKRVTRKGGLVAIFEHNPFNPLTLRAVNHCEMDEDAILLRRGKTQDFLIRHDLNLLESRYILFTPFEGAFFRGLDRLLGWLPFGAQYYVVGK